MTNAVSVRTTLLQSRTKLIKLCAVGVTVFNVLGIGFSVSTYINLHASLDVRSGSDLLLEVREDFAAYEAMEKGARENMAEIRQMDGSIDLDISKNQILATANVLQASEKDFQIFYRLLKVNIYHLAGEIPGSMSWYEIYGPEIDLAIERSRSRQLKILQIQQAYAEAV